MQVLQGQLRDLVPYYLTNADVAKRVELKSGFSQEMRIYWNDRNSYLYYYALLHQRDDGVIVLQFSINTRAEPILEKF